MRLIVPREEEQCTPFLAPLTLAEAVEYVEQHQLFFGSGMSADRSHWVSVYENFNEDNASTKWSATFEGAFIAAVNDYAAWRELR